MPAKTIIDVVTGGGYDVPLTTGVIDVDGMTCANCVNRVPQALAQVEGVVASDVNLATEQATVEYVPGAVETDELLAAVTSAGYEAAWHEDVAEDDAETRQEAARKKLLRRVVFAAAFPLPLVILDIGGMMIPAFGAWLQEMIG